MLISSITDEGVEADLNFCTISTFSSSIILVYISVTSLKRFSMQLCVNMFVSRVFKIQVALKCCFSIADVGGGCRTDYTSSWSKASLSSSNSMSSVITSLAGSSVATIK